MQGEQCAGLSIVYIDTILFRGFCALVLHSKQHCEDSAGEMMVYDK